jgi:hypothetical protein
MGCDIHAFVETSYDGREGRTWFSLCDFRFGRNYLLFALMAGVRRYEYLPDAVELEHALSKRGVKKLDDPLLSEAEIQTIVREASDTGITRGQPSFDEKGMPRDVAWKAAEAYTLIVMPDDDPEAGAEKCCSKSDANGWVSGGSSEVWDKAQDGSMIRVTGPDWHTASWLDTSEMELVATRFRAALEASIPDVKVEQERALEWARKAMERALVADDAEGLAFAKREVESASRWQRWDPLRDETLAKVEGLVAMMKRLEANGDVKARVVFWFDN